MNRCPKLDHLRKHLSEEQKKKNNTKKQQSNENNKNESQSRIFGKKRECYDVYHHITIVLFFSRIEEAQKCDDISNVVRTFYANKTCNWFDGAMSRHEMDMWCWKKRPTDRAKRNSKKK